MGLDAAGRKLAAAGPGGAWLFDLQDPTGGARLLKHPGATSVAISPDGNCVASGTHHGFGVKVFETNYADRVPSPLISFEQSTRVLFSPDGRWLVGSTPDEFRLWRAGFWDGARAIRRQQSLYNQSTAISPDGRLLALTISLSAVQLRDPATDHIWAELQSPDTGPISLVGFSPDGSQLLVAAYAGDLRVWDLRRIREQLRELDLDWDLPPYPPAAASPGAPVKSVEVVGHPLGLHPRPYLVRADGAARRGDWQAAAADYRQALQLDPSNHVTWHDASVLLLQSGDIDGYRWVCREMLSRFGRTDAANIAERTVKTCCLAPGGLDDYKPVLALADRTVSGSENSADYRWFLLARGMADYRTGDFARAADWLRRSLSPGRELPIRDGLAHLFLAMVHYRLGRTNEARLALAQARLMGERIALINASDIENWPDTLRFHIARREAEELLGNTSDQ
jgi:tetratricopeptide (TPR) repeat protein